MKEKQQSEDDREPVICNCEFEGLCWSNGDSTNSAIEIIPSVRRDVKRPGAVIGRRHRRGKFWSDFDSVLSCFVL